jgi:hypothetical protein
MVQKMLFCSTNISAEILPHILGHRFLALCRIMVHFCQMLLQLTAAKNIDTKAVLAVVPKMSPSLTLRCEMAWKWQTL